MEAINFDSCKSLYEPDSFIAQPQEHQFMHIKYGHLFYIISGRWPILCLVEFGQGGFEAVADVV